jgi:hypothetical protein
VSRTCPERIGGISSKARFFLKALKPEHPASARYLPRLKAPAVRPMLIHGRHNKEASYRLNLDRNKLFPFMILLLGSDKKLETFHASINMTRRLVPTLVSNGSYCEA